MNDERTDEKAPQQTSEVDIEHLEEDVERLEQVTFTESTVGTREDMQALWRWVVYGVALILSLFHLYTATYGTLPSLQQRSFHLGVGLGLIVAIARSFVPIADRFEIANFLEMSRAVVRGPYDLSLVEGSITTAADRESQEVILRHLRSAFPSDAYRAEEATATLAAAGVEPARTAEFPTPAKRPVYSVMDNRRAGAALGLRLPHWSDLLASDFKR